MLEAIGTDREFSTIEREYRDMEAVTLTHGIFEKNLKNIAVVAGSRCPLERLGIWRSSSHNSQKRMGRLPIPAKGGIAMKVPKSNAYHKKTRGESTNLQFSEQTRNRLPRGTRSIDLVAEGHKSKEIAQLLGTSVKTVETHRATSIISLLFAM
ncbi:MAG: hypothetical protein MPW14_25855 (plasmid) [Candidatus Manganitrophus sp.]|nr:MAG: hypothetical protein MPW14_25855 [Candidatus Manganitrophus sp.]